jgi:hypothetical protein
MARSILAVVVGFLVIGALSFGTDFLVLKAFPDAFDRTHTSHAGILLLMFTYVAVYATFGCWLAARLAPSRPLRHALALGVLGMMFTTAGTIARWDDAPAWFHVAMLTTVMLWAWLGGTIRERQLAGARTPSRAVAA